VDDETPLFGIVFVDTATGAFSLTEFQDDVELTKFETFVAQIRPKELILEKVCTYCFLVSDCSHRIRVVYRNERFAF